MKLLLICMAVTTAWAPAVQAQTLVPATDNDMRAAYCFKVDDLSLADLQASGFVASANAAQQTQLARLTSERARFATYLMARLLSIEPMGIVLAMKRAQDDVSQLRQNQNAPDEAARVGRCRDLSWLPF